MPGQDQESFHLLQISESQSDSLPDLDLVTVNTQHKKKKVRLKRYGSCHCQALVSSPVPLDPIPILNPKQPQ